jgi:hypothetical protein
MISNEHDDVKKTLALIIDDTQKLSGLEFGQTAERTIYVRPILPKETI